MEIKREINTDYYYYIIIIIYKLKLINILIN